ncbi:hypothetical protein V9T40_007455 [Parthenolecanium corni]|uniref:Uncharacterized protein n=1 Tax=Parthenolecanium corni TaxID=536013 RepID=A0AAN9Y5V2_9HEMI
MVLLRPRPTTVLAPPISHSSHPPLTGSRRLSRATRGSIIAAGCRPRAARIPVPVAAPAPVPPSGRFRILRSVGDLARRLPHCLLLEPSKRATSLNGRLDVNVVRAAFAIRHFDLGCEKRKSAQRDAAETRRRNESKSTNTRRTLIYELRVRLHRGVRCVAFSCPALGSMPERTRPATNHDSESRRLASPPSSYRLAASRSVVAFRFADATSVCRERRRRPFCNFEPVAKDARPNEQRRRTTILGAALIRSAAVASSPPPHTAARWPADRLAASRFRLLPSGGLATITKPE